MNSEPVIVIENFRPTVSSRLDSLLDALDQDCKGARGCAESANIYADAHFYFVRKKSLALDSPLACEPYSTSGDIVATLATGAEPFELACNHDWNRSQFTTKIVEERLKDLTRELLRLRNSVLPTIPDDRGPKAVKLWMSFREKIRKLSKWVYAAVEDTETVAIGEILRAQEARNVPRDIWHHLQDQTGVWESSEYARLGRLFFKTTDAYEVLRTSMPHVDRIDSVIFDTPWYRAFESTTIVSARLMSVMSQVIIIDRYLNVTAPEDSVGQSGTLSAEVQAGLNVDEKTEEYTKKDVDGFKGLDANIRDIVCGYILTAAVVTEKLSGAGIFGKLFTDPVFPNTSGLAVLPLGLCNLPLKPGE
jgi:hypothetical protein